MYELSVRRDDGGNLGSYKLITVPLALRTEGATIVVLVHGFNTSERGAAEGWEKFEARLRLASRPSSQLLICGFHWAGDHRLRFLSPPTFSNRIPVAEAAGDRLARVIWELPANQIVLVGHSLGCRAVLHALLVSAAEAPPDAPKITYAFLMAAAVSESECAEGGAYEFDATNGPRQVIFHSKRDRVLQHLFRPGTVPYNGFPSVAVGRSGGPPKRWDLSSEQVPLGHGAYWSSFAVSGRIAAVAGFSWERALRTRTPTTAPDVVDEQWPDEIQPDEYVPRTASTPFFDY